MGRLNEEEIGALIQGELYFKIKVFIESQYDSEDTINPLKRDSKKILFKDRKKAINMVKEAIEEFSIENNIDIKIVTAKLLELIDKNLDREDNIHENEDKEVKKILLTDNELEI